MIHNLNHQIGGFPKVSRLCIDPGLHNRTKFMAVLFTRCLVARQLLSPKLIERERERESSLRSRRYEVFGRIKERACQETREETREGRESACPRGPWKSLPDLYPGSRCVICQKFWQNTIDLAHTKRAKAFYIYILDLNIRCKDQLGHLIIERWSNKTTVNTELYIIFNKTNNRTESKIGIF